MGFFDAFKKQPKNQEPRPVEKNEEARPYTVKQSPEGRLQIDYSTPDKRLKEFYDMTRLIIDNKQININGRPFTQALVSWYGADDCIRIDRATNREISRRTDYSKIITQLDVNRLLNEPEYGNAVMNKLLDQGRVNRYLQRGLENNPSQPCGNYIGSIANRNGEYIKIFDTDIGEAVHNSPEMTERRREYKQMREYALRKEMERKQQEMDELKRRMEDIQR